METYKQLLEWMEHRGVKHPFNEHNFKPAFTMRWLMNEYGISVGLVTDCTWYASCCHWGEAYDIDVVEAVMKCVIDYFEKGGD